MLKFLTGLFIGVNVGVVVVALCRATGREE